MSFRVAWSGFGWREFRVVERSKGDVEAHNKRARTYLATECSVSTHGHRAPVLGP